MLCNYLFFASPKQKDTGDLTAQNSELKLELQTLERQVHLIDGNSRSLAIFAGWFWFHSSLPSSSPLFGFSQNKLKKEKRNGRKIESKRFRLEMTLTSECRTRLFQLSHF